MSNGFPLAVPLMILLGTKDIHIKNQKVQALISPLYGIDAMNPPARQKKLGHASQQLRSSGCRMISFHDLDEPQETDPSKTCRELYQMILKRIQDFNFDALREYLHYFYSVDIGRVATLEDIRDCYRVLTDAYTQSSGKDFSEEFCWKIAAPFLHKKSDAINFPGKKEFFDKRREMIRSASGAIRIAGTTLKHAFSLDHELREGSIIHEIFENPNIHDVYVYLLNYAYINISHETASDEIEKSLKNIFDMISRNAGNKTCRFHIVLLSDFKTPFVLMTDDGMVLRNTYLFVESRCFCGEYLYFERSDEPLSEYAVLKNYLNFLDENAYEVDLKYGDEIRLFDLKKKMNSDPRIKDRVEMKKTNTAQIENLVRRSFQEPPPKDCAPMTCFVRPDATQQALIPFLQDTEELLERIVKKHDTAGWAKVVPSAGLGFSGNVVRMAGGFFAGALYDWSCSVPLVPIDASVNTCTCSVFRLSAFDESMSNAEFHNLIENLNIEGAKEGYHFNFKSYNHFLTVAKNAVGSYYLLIHTSAREGPDNTFGLYPGGNSTWFSEEIKTEINRAQTRYMRYIRGQSAIQLIDYSKRFREVNEKVHRFIADWLCRHCGMDAVEIAMHHLYGMPTDSSINIGAFVVDIYDHAHPVPIFGARNGEICLFRVSRDQTHPYTLAETNRDFVVVPYNFGSIVEGVEQIAIDNPQNADRRALRLMCKDRQHAFRVTQSARIDDVNLKKERSEFTLSEFITKNNCFFAGDPCEMLTPVKTYPGRI